MPKKPTRQFIQLSEGEKNYAMSRAVVQGDWCFVSGTMGYDYKKEELPESAAQQAMNTFTNIRQVYRVRPEICQRGPADYQSAF